MPKIVFTTVLLFLCSLLSAQKTIQIKGKIIDEESKVPIESATVYLTNPKDSTVIEYSITNKMGVFDFKLKKIAQPVILKVSFVTYQDHKLELKELTKDHDFGTIALKSAINTLDEVVVKNETPPIRIKKDTVEFNAASFKVRPDANVETLLKQLPGVEIDADGKITVNGKEVNQILVNGKPFFDKDGKVALQNLPSNIINKVQVSDTKTKEEQKTGSAATSNNASINLTIDEKKNKGWFGKVMAGGGSDKRYESSTLINYFNNKRKVSVLASSNNINATGFSMDEIFDNMGGGRNSSIWMSDNGGFSINGRRFGGNNGITHSNLAGVNYADEWLKDSPMSMNYFFNDLQTRNENRTKQLNLLPSGNYETESWSNYKNSATAHNASGEFEIVIDSTMSFVFEPKWSRSLGQNKSNATQQSRDALAQLLNESTSDNYSENTSDIFGNTLSFSKSFAKKGRYLSIVFSNEHQKEDATNFVNSRTQFFQNVQPDDVRNQRNSTYNKYNQYSYDVNYYEPLRDSIRLKTSIYQEFANSKNGRSSFEYDAINQDYTNANDFLNNAYASKEQTFRPTAGLSSEKAKFNWSFDLGPQWTKMNNAVDYLGINTQLQKNFFTPYVESYISYRFTKSRNFWLSYNYQNEVPNASQLLPVEDLSNPLNTVIGNANLDASRRHGLYLNFRDFDYATRSGYGMYSGGNFYDTQIVSATAYDANRKRTTTYTNVAGTYNSWFGLYWNKSYKKEAHKFRYELRMATNFGLSKGITDGNVYKAQSVSLNPRVSFTYEYGEKLIVNPSYQYTRNITDYTNYVVESAANYLHRFNLQTTLYWPKNWVFGNDFGYTYNSNIADGFKKDFYLWNTSLSYSFWNKKFTAKVKVYDLLNQNQNATRTITATTIRDEQNVVLKRYVMFSLTYKLDKFGAGEKKESRRFMMY
ncbi:outer membrane beta-barrel protein [Flavobacterium stagni]|uniref:TonB-dependent receptor n=1 Tax=Flavobacterium stagni TaxID=2506421 RepID=A0A4V1N2K3_9FLAO|nr:outer membrane beta-barrel protein [Flavobacterium stagni]RXR22187.1 TonB-dependent receptor [Flavobacterium stagni]